LAQARRRSARPLSHAHTGRRPCKTAQAGSIRMAAGWPGSTPQLGEVAASAAKAALEASMVSGQRTPGDALTAAAVAYAERAISQEDFELDQAEQALQVEVALADLRLEHFKLASKLQRYREQPPTLEDLAQHRMEELEELEAEVQWLHADNAKLAFHPDRAADMAPDAGGAFIGQGAASSSRSVPGGGDSPRPGAKHRARTAPEELSDEVCTFRSRHLEHRRCMWHAQEHEHLLTECRVEAQQVVRQLRVQDRRLEESRRSKAAAEAHLGDLEQLLVQGRQDLEQEQNAICELNREVSELREACYVPARLRRESGFLVRALDQGAGGRLNTRKHLWGIEACTKLYEGVSSQAPSLLPLMGRVRADLEAQFARYLQLEEAHNRALQRLHVAVTRDVYSRNDRPASAERRRSRGA